ncbi:MAG: MarR family EPS-associated transcriptional regulator [Deltaproteobacteria bacterium]|nr:MarR family EPS-associated transcriptional regulator [Deltaproteobacteria bacterium]
MNHAFEQEIHYRLLNILAEEPQLGQREIAVKMGISVGKVNYCLSELAKKGLIKVKRFKSAKTKIPYTYKLTPKGIEEKGRITVGFLKRKLEEYEEIKRQIQDLTLDVEQNGLSTMARGELTQAAALLR